MSGQPASPRAPIGVLGLWHLGSVTAACLAEAGLEVVGVDPDASVVEGLASGRAPIAEPGLDEVLREQLAGGRLRFTTDPAALGDAGRAWVAFDTPVDEDDRADVESVLGAATRLLAALPGDSLVVVSSQLPVGSVAALERALPALRFACVPENLRLGGALEAFRHPERIVAGVRSDRDRDELAGILEAFTGSLEWMRVESAEMTKHALNGFLATSVAYINEVAGVCEAVGADAAEVARGLKSERRIGPRAYLSPGDAFAGGTLARDVGFLQALAADNDVPGHVFSGVAAGNEAHRLWTRRKLVEHLGSVDGASVAVWGLTYKPGTDTLRRSGAVELCRWLAGEGASVRAHDPAVNALPQELAGAIELHADAVSAAQGADALVLCTPWPQFREHAAAGAAALARPLVIDPAGFLADALAGGAVAYVRVGTPPGAVGVGGAS